MTDAVKFEDYVRAVYKGQPVEGRVIRPGMPGVALVQLTDGRNAWCRAVARVEGVWASVCELVTSVPSFFATASPAAVTIAVGSQTAKLVIKPADVGKGRGWKGTETVYLDVVGGPHLCKVTVTIVALGSEKWGDDPTHHDTP